MLKTLIDFVRFKFNLAKFTFQFRFFAHSNVGSKFDVTTGKLVWRPPDIWIDEGVKDKPRFEVKVKNGDLFISTEPI